MIVGHGPVFPSRKSARRRGRLSPEWCDGCAGYHVGRPQYIVPCQRCRKGVYLEHDYALDAKSGAHHYCVGNP